METDEGESQLKAYISNLVTALGGPDLADPKHPYVLGDDALACLRDLKKWLQFYDNKLNRWDVAKAISETTLVSVDLVEILTSWELGNLEGHDMSHRDKIALACLEILVPLTWPLELNNITTTENQFQNAPHLAQAQKKYKKAILLHPRHAVLRAVLRLTLKPMATEPKERTPREEGILKLAVYFLRNILLIDDTDRDDVEDENPISRSVTIFEFGKQRALDFILTMCAGIGDKFDIQDTILLECLFALFNGVSVNQVFLGEIKEHQSGNHLEDMLEQEKKLRSAVFQPSRHSRFGTMISLGLADQSRLSVSGQKAIASVKSTLDQIDELKRWRRPYRKINKEKEKWDLHFPLDAESRQVVKTFVNNFIEAAFNPFFLQIRSLIERDSDRVGDTNLVHYFFLLGWFLHAQRVRHRKIDFQLVGSALNQKTFIVVMKLMRAGHETGQLQSSDLVHAAMICFRNILEMVQHMSTASGDWADTAENIKSRLFYEELWLDLLCQLPRHANKQSLAYACECVELTHVVLKMLQDYSRQYTYLFVKSKRKRKKQQAAEASAEYSEDEDDEQVHHEASRVTAERKFDFSKFEDRYANDLVVDTYERVLRSYRDVDTCNIKHVLAYFYRFFEKRGYHALFFRVGIMKLLLEVSSTRGGVVNESLRGAYEKFMQHYTRILTKSLARTPCLCVEMLFAKISKTEPYLDGRDSSQRQIKEPQVQYVFTDSTLSLERKFAVTVAALLDGDQGPFIDWVRESLQELIANTDDTTKTRVFCDDSVRLKYLSKHGIARLLLRLIGCQEQHKMNGKQEYAIPSSVDTLELITALEFIDMYRKEPVTFADNGTAFDQIRVSNNSDKDNASSNIAEDSENDSDDARHFADPRLQALPEEERRVRQLSAKKARAAKRKANGKGITLGNKKRKETASTGAETIAEKQRKELERLQRLKNTAFVHPSDDESEAERDSLYFQRELGLGNSKITGTLDLPSVSQVVDRTQLPGAGSPGPVSDLELSSDGQFRATVVSHARRGLFVDDSSE